MSIKATINDNYFFYNKNTRAMLATKINKNQGLVLKTIGVNFVVNYSYLAIRLERSAHSLYSFSRTSIQERVLFLL